MLLFCCRKRLAELPRRFAWYPGSDKRSAAFKAKFRDAEELGTAVEGGETSAGFLPWIFKSGLTPDEVGAASAVAGKQLKTVSFLWAVDQPCVSLPCVSQAGTSQLPFFLENTTLLPIIQWRLTSWPLDRMQADTETENWCGVLQEVALPDTGPDPASFLAAAVDFANNRLGTGVSGL